MFSFFTIVILTTSPNCKYLLSYLGIMPGNFLLTNLISEVAACIVYLLTLSVSFRRVSYSNSIYIHLCNIFSIMQVQRKQALLKIIVVYNLLIQKVYIYITYSDNSSVF